MKSNPFHNLLLSAIAIALTCTFSCNKPYIPVGKETHEEPFNDYLWYNKLLNLQESTQVGETEMIAPLEIGYTFQSSVAGIVDKLGLMLPDSDSGKVYTVSLWDSAPRRLMIQKDIKVQTPNVFNYVDLNATNEFQIIFANHTYVVGVCIVPVGEQEPHNTYPCSYIQSTFGNIFPFAGYQHVVTYYREFTSPVEPVNPTPVFPENLYPYTSVITGFCDIEFSYMKPFNQQQ